MFYNEFETNVLKEGSVLNSKDYLQQAYTIDRQIRLDIQKLDSMRGALYGRAISYDKDGSKTASKTNGMEDSMVRVLDYERHVNEEIDRLTAKRTEIEKDIYTVSDDTLREILIRRYLLYQKWELIAEEMNYGVRHIYKLHLKALREFSEIMREAPTGNSPNITS